MNNEVKILLADDDAEDRLIMADTFSELNLRHTVYFVENGESILTYLEKLDPDMQLPSLIILDLNMPRMNGTQTLKSLKNHDRYKNIPVIIFSTSVNTIEMVECMKTGAASYVVKPVTYKECIDTARTFYEYSINGLPN